jgi:transcriptional regulator with XRE-family HTH domain
MKLSEKIMKVRKEQNLSQEEFGNKINVSRQAVSKWENGESKPEIDKIQEICKTFNVSYEYLLNDEIDKQEAKENCRVKKDEKPKKKLAIKIILFIFVIYLLFCVYKFIAFYRFYLIANSFSEEKYFMSQSVSISNQLNTNKIFDTIKVGDKMIQTYYSYENSETLQDEDGNILPHEIEFTDFDKKICYQLDYDKEKKMYIYHDRKEDMINDEEIEELFKDDNIVKSNTLANIPSGLKDILLASIDPRYYYVSIQNRQYRVVSFSNNLKRQVQLNNDYLIESINQKFEYNESMSISFSYDYVQDHFESITDPLETYKNKIVFEEDI